MEVWCLFIVWQQQSWDVCPGTSYASNGVSQPNNAIKIHTRGPLGYLTVENTISMISEEYVYESYGSES